MNNGKIIVWQIEYKGSLDLNPVYEFFAHEDAVNCIHINERLNVLVTGGEDGGIFVRNLYDYEILTYIKPASTSIVVDIKISELDYIYSTIWINSESQFRVLGYNLNGQCFTKTSGLISNLDFTKKGIPMIGYYNNNKIIFANPINLQKVN